jgi:DNA-directed RNA polymerase specialized sigma24 family protein
MITRTRAVDNIRGNHYAALTLQLEDCFYLAASGDLEIFRREKWRNRLVERSVATLPRRQRQVIQLGSSKITATAKLPALPDCLWER